MGEDDGFFQLRSSDTYQNETKMTDLGGTHTMHGTSLVILTLTDVTSSCVLCGTYEIMLF